MGKMTLQDVLRHVIARAERAGVDVAIQDGVELLRQHGHLGDGYAWTDGARAALAGLVKPAHPAGFDDRPKVFDHPVLFVHRGVRWALVGDILRGVDHVGRQFEATLADDAAEERRYATLAALHDEDESAVIRVRQGDPGDET